MSNPNQETTPDQLMKTFEGRSLKSIILFTIVVHAVLLIGTSVPYLMGAVTGGDTSEMSEEERLTAAAKEATAAIREIAERNGVKPQDLSSRFADGTPKAPTAASGNEPRHRLQKPPHLMDPKNPIRSSKRKSRRWRKVPSSRQSKTKTFSNKPPPSGDPKIETNA